MEFWEPTTHKAFKKSPANDQTTLRVDAYPACGLSWSDAPKRKLERQLTEICVSLLRLAEDRLRQGALQEHEWRLERRQEVREALAKRAQEAEANRIHELRQRQQQRHDSMKRLARDRHDAEQLRLLVDVVRMHPDRQGANLEAAIAWEREVLDLADSIDPIHQPIAKILA